MRIEPIKHIPVRIMPAIRPVPPVEKSSTADDNRPFRLSPPPFRKAIASNESPLQKILLRHFSKNISTANLGPQKSEEQLDVATMQRSTDPKHTDATEGGFMSGTGLSQAQKGRLPFLPGCYTTPQGNKWWLKAAETRTLYPTTTVDQYGRPTQRGTIRSKNAMARMEYTAHRLFGLFATPSNNIGKIDARLISGQTGKEIEDNYDHQDHVDGSHHEVPMYLATPDIGESTSGIRDNAIDHLGKKVTGAPAKYSQLSTQDREDMYREMWKHHSKGAIVDAFLGLGDIHGGNIYSDNTPDENGNRAVHRLDVGDSLGWRHGRPPDASDPREPFYGSQYTIFPQLIANLNFHGRAHNPIATGVLTGDDILNQAREVLTTWKAKLPEFFAAMKHMPHKIMLASALLRRAKSLEKMLETYGSRPDGGKLLEQELLSLRPTNPAIASKSLQRLQTALRKAAAPHSTQEKLELPPAGAIGLEPHQMRRVGGIGEGVSYREGHGAMPHPLGVYETPSGSQWWLKGAPGYTYNPDIHVKNEDALPIPTTREYPKIASLNSMARLEHAAHRLYGVFATPENQIGKIDARLISAETGKEIPHDYDHGDEENGRHHRVAMYLATPNLEPHATKFTRVSAPTFPNPLAQFCKGLVVDSLFGLGDTHSSNIFADNHPDQNGKHKVYRLDTGYSLGWGAGKPETGLDIVTSSFYKKQGVLLPELAYNANARLYQAAITPKQILDQAREVISTWKTKQDEIEEALKHAPHPDMLYEALRRRIRSLELMVDTFGSDPSQLDQELRFPAGYRNY